MRTELPTPAVLLVAAAAKQTVYSVFVVLQKVQQPQPITPVAL